MPSPITLENRLTLSQAGRLVGKSPSAIFRWARDGIAGERLEAIFLGGSMFTSAPALEDFGRRAALAKLRIPAARRAPDREAVEAGL